MIFLKIKEATFSKKIKAAKLINKNQCVCLLENGDVIRYNFTTLETSILFSVKSLTQYSDGGFDIEAPSSIYTLDDIVVVVNDFKRHGYIHYPNQFKKLHLWREDYHANISKYPICLFKNNEGIPHIIYGVHWNHLQIMNLDNRQILTAAKSLIKENAEEDHIEFHKNYKDANNHPWPSPYDYFYGELFLSPDQKRILSAGWAWGSSDAYYIYDIPDFIKNPRIKDLIVDYWEHNNRGVCWIDNQTVAVTYDPVRDDDEEKFEEGISQIHIYNITDNSSTIKNKISIKNIDLLSSDMHYSSSNQYFILHNAKIGVVFISLDGEVIHQEKDFMINSYCNQSDQYLSFNDKTLSIYQHK